MCEFLGPKKGLSDFVYVVLLQYRSYSGIVFPQIGHVYVFSLFKILICDSKIEGQNEFLPHSEFLFYNYQNKKIRFFYFIVVEFFL